jgi:hypothetical protein
MCSAEPLPAPAHGSGVATQRPPTPTTRRSTPPRRSGRRPGRPAGPPRPRGRNLGQSDDLEDHAEHRGRDQQHGAAAPRPARRARRRWAVPRADIRASLRKSHRQPKSILGSVSGEPTASDSGAMQRQILVNTDKRVDAVPRSGGAGAERDFEVLVPCPGAGHAGGGSPQRGERRSGLNEFVISRITRRVLPAFRRGTFEVTVLDGRPLPCRGSRG